jgi:hypothetical protein
MGGAALGAIGGIGGSGFSYFTSNHPLQNIDDNAIPVDGDALVDPDHPGHREAIKTISHVDDDKHEKITQWLKDEIHRIDHGSGPQK